MSGNAGAVDPVVISEIMYHPVELPAFNAEGAPVLDLYEDVHEFIELHQAGDRPISLEGWQITGGIHYRFTNAITLGPGQYLVLARDPERLAAVEPYALAGSMLLGPWSGQLSNQGETISLINAQGQTVDSVSYSASFPWAIGADGLGAEDEWTGLQSTNYQYRGRSLERVSFKESGQDPANWLASPIPGNPSPGRPNAVHRDSPKPIVIGLLTTQASNGQLLIRPDQPIRIECRFSSSRDLSHVRLEYFQENLDVTNEAHTTVSMLSLGNPGEGRFVTQLPGKTARSLVRYRIQADRGEGDETVSPRADDPFRWHSCFVSPLRTGTNPVYEVFISAKSLTALSTNISGNPRRITLPDPPGKPRASWNATQPAVFVYNGVVYDIQMRHHGSQYRRDPNRRSYKVQFPRYQKFDGHASVFLTDKDALTQMGHAFFREVGLPTSLTRWIDLYLNSNARLVRLEQEECDDDMLDRYHREQAGLHPDQPRAETGEIYKAQGVLEGTLGPFGRADGSRLLPRTNYWTSLQRYEYTYGLQDHAWVGHQPLSNLISQMWVARNNRTAPPGTNEINKLRPFIAQNWDLDKTLTYLATINWMVPWDDTIHNYFLWRQRDGRWGMMPWDFDNVMSGQSSSASIFNGAPFAGPNYFKESCIYAYREEFRQRAWWLNNTLLHPDHLATLNLPSSLRSWSTNRFRSVNTQTGLGTFQRPNRPVNRAPLNRQPATPWTLLVASPYTHTTNPAPAHVATTWMIRPAQGSYYAPVYLASSTLHLESLPLPVEALQAGETYYWRCYYVDAIGHPSVASAETALIYAQPSRQSGDIVLNEIVADNRPTVETDGQHSDWIELYNPGNEEKSLGGLSLTDDLAQPYRYVFPVASQLPAKGFVRVWCDKATTAPGLHTGFGLKGEGQTVALLASSTNGLGLQDLITYGPQLPGLSIGRVPDGSGRWTLTVATPGLANQEQPTGAANALKLNEWMAQSAGGDDWVELFNPEALPVALEGLCLTDDLSNPTRHRLAPLSFIGPGGFVQFLADAQTSKGAEHLNFRLNAQGGALGLCDTNGAILDSVFYGLQLAGVSEGRLPDGAPTLYRFPILATPGRSNAQDSDGDGLPDAWEIAYGLNPFYPFDASVDSDQDGVNNLGEYWTGTDPQSPLSLLRFETLEYSELNHRVTVSFSAAPGKTYTVEYRDGVGGADWQRWQDVSAQPGPRLMTLFDDSILDQPTRFYRLVTPQRP